MLVLSRKKDESIVIDGTIVITVVEVRGDKVRLGIEAPKDIPVSRPDAKTGPKATPSGAEESPHPDSDEAR